MYKIYYLFYILTYHPERSDETHKIFHYIQKEVLVTP